MKKLLVALVGALTLGATLPALAGPDWQAIEHARKAKQAAQGAHHGDVYEGIPPTGAGSAKCPPDAPVLQLDHGAHAQTTPYQNQLRKERYEAQAKACRTAAPDKSDNPARPGK